MKEQEYQTGLIHLYCGDGKGKTTAAVGQAIRCAGYGYPVLFFQFLKEDTSSERIALKHLQNITLIAGVSKAKFTFRMTAEEKEKDRLFYLEKLKEIKQTVEEKKIQVLVLDEAVNAVSTGLLEEKELLSFLQGMPNTLEVILTGRNPTARLIDLADYVTEMRMVKHPYTKGCPARPGIEK